MKETDNVEVADTYQLQRIANALEEILRLVKEDQEDKKYMEDRKDDDKEKLQRINCINAGWEINNGGLSQLL